MADKEYIAALQALTAKIDGLIIAGDLRDTAGERREDILNAINGYVREHGELLAAHTEWFRGHKKVHEVLDKNLHTLSNRLFAISGGTGLLAVAATILQFVKL